MNAFEKLQELEKEKKKAAQLLKQREEGEQEYRLLQRKNLFGVFSEHLLSFHNQKIGTNKFTVHLDKKEWQAEFYINSSIWLKFSTGTQWGKCGCSHEAGPCNCAVAEWPVIYVRINPDVDSRVRREFGSSAFWENGTFVSEMGQFINEYKKKR